MEPLSRFLMRKLGTGWQRAGFGALLEVRVLGFGISDSGGSQGIFGGD